MAHRVGLPAKLAFPDGFPIQGAIGLLLILIAWPASWLHLGLAGQYAFFPLWLDYILLVDGIVLRRIGGSLLTRHPAVFLATFIASAPLWWAFEGINHYTRNWHYLGAEDYSAVHYAVVATWHFTIVVPAVFETAELVGSFGFMARFRRGAVLPVSRGFLLGCIALGLFSLAALLVWPQYVFPVTWLCALLVLDPVNHLTGRPSLIAALGRGDWRLVVALATAALVCGWFWEMWNYWAFPKWEYQISFVGVAHVFEMPLLGYSGYIPFGLEVYAGFHFAAGLVSWASKGRLEFGTVRPVPAVGHSSIHSGGEGFAGPT